MKNGTIYHSDIFHFLANLIIYQFLFSTLRPKNSPDINGGFWVTIRYPMTYQKNTMSFTPPGGGHKPPIARGLLYGSKSSTYTYLYINFYFRPLGQKVHQISTVAIG